MSISTKKVYTLPFFLYLCSLKNMLKRLGYIVAVAGLLVSCNGMQQLLKEKNPEVKYEAAKNLFQEKKYAKCSQLLEDVATYYKGTGRAEEVLYLLAESYRGQENYVTAAEYYNTYVKNYPRGTYAQECNFMIGFCYYKDSADPRLDQTSTHNALEAFTAYLEQYPLSDRSSETYQYIFELEDKLAYKGYLNAKLYYNLGMYLGNNFRSAIICANNTLKDYPETKHREALLFLVLQAKYKEAVLSVHEKKSERFSEVIDEYYNYSSEYPNGKYIRDANRMLKEAKAHVKQ